MMVMFHGGDHDDEEEEQQEQEREKHDRDGDGDDDDHDVYRNFAMHVETYSGGFEGSQHAWTLSFSQRPPA